MLSMVRKKTSKTSKTKGNLVKNHEQFVEFDWKDYSVFDNMPNSKTPRSGGGIYALYDNHGLYYVGLAGTSLRSRIKRHTVNKHHKKWKRFSWYHVPNVRAIKDLESVLISVLDPKGNTNKGKLRKK